MMLLGGGASAKEEGAVAPRRRRDALVFSRYVASTCILLYHWFDRVPATHMPAIVRAGMPFDVDSETWHGFLHWLSTWTSFFFVLSGFVLTMARLSSTRTKSTLRFVLERLTTTYPAYFTSLLAFLLVTAPDLWKRTHGDWKSFATHLTLTQAWFPPDASRGGVVWNGPSWFMSALLFYWVLFKPLSWLVDHVSFKWPALVTCWLLSSLAWVDSFFDHAIARALMPRPPWPRNAKTFADVYHYNPLFSLNSFLAGMLLAKIFVQGEEDDDDEPRPLWRKIGARGAELGYALFAILVLFVPIPPAFSRDGAQVGGLFSAIHNGGLLPLHCLLLVGLATEEDSISRLFRRPSFAWWGAISYEQYVLQTAVFKLLNDIFLAVSRGPGHEPYDGLAWQLAMPLAITAAAFATHHLVSLPCAAFLRRQLNRENNPTKAITDAFSETSALLGGGGPEGASDKLYATCTDLPLLSSSSSSQRTAGGTAV